MRQYPQLEIDLSLLQSNARAVISRCNAAGICVCGVIKGADGLPEIARTLRVPEGTVKSRLSRGRERLRTLLSEEASEKEDTT